MGGDAQRARHGNTLGLSDPYFQKVECRLSVDCKLCTDNFYFLSGSNENYKLVNARHLLSTSTQEGRFRL